MQNKVAMEKRLTWQVIFQYMFTHADRNVADLLFL
jgi:hypothetical protein